MTNQIASVASVSDSTAGLPRSEPDIAPAASHRPANPEDRADLRLIIEEDQATGSFVYKTLDRNTGEVVNQFPREQVLRLKQQQGYRAGALISAKA